MTGPDMRLVAGACCAVAVLSGCIATKPAEPEIPKLDAAEAMLLDAALRAETAVTRLAALEGNPAGDGDIPRIVPEGLLQRVDFEWIGPVEEAARRLARAAGYRFETAGLRPVTPAMVEIRSRGRPLIMVLRDVGLQAGGAASVTVDAERGLVVLDWTGTGK